MRLSYVLGLQRLGWNVHFVEQIAAAACSDAALEYFDGVVEAFGLSQSSTLLRDDGKILRGPPGEQLLALAEASDLLLNISGNLRCARVLECCRRKAYVDLDPGYTQVWYAQGRLPELASHDLCFTVGERVGEASSPLPHAGIEWRPTRPPVVLDEWPVVDSGDRDRFTTVASWRGGYGPLEHAGRTYSLKVHEFRKVVELPVRSRQSFELALDIDPAEQRDRDALHAHGWRLVDPGEVAGTPAAFRRYVQGSGAEFSVAQGVYVQTSSGWFSDRTTRYLASGKPALVQETGFSRAIPTGEGLLTFRTLDEAASGAESIAADYDRHSGAARRLAEQIFDSDRVLSRLLEGALQ